MKLRLRPLDQLRVVCAAMPGGVAMFGAVAIFLRVRGDVSSTVLTPEAWLGITGVFLVVGGGAWILVRKVIVASARRHAANDRSAGGRGDPAVLEKRYFAIAIMGLALTEALGLLGVIAFLLNGGWGLLVIPALAVVLMAAQFPTDGRLRAFEQEVLGV